MRPALSLFHGLRAAQPSLPRTAISRSTSRSLSQLRHRSTRPSLASPLAIHSRTLLPSSIIRQNSSSSSSSSSSNNNNNKPLTDQDSNAAREAENAEQNRKRREEEPAYQITFTCKPCGERSSHHMSKHGYHRGTVLIRCPSCQNRHVISDHLNIFFDKKTTLEDILSERGAQLTRGYVDGDMEFWDDGVAHKRESGSEGSS